MTSSWGNRDGGIIAWSIVCSVRGVGMQNADARAVDATNRHTMRCLVSSVEYLCATV
jgi:hypothetical protein